MNCPACGQENPAGAKFCNQCAASLPLACSNCGTSNAPGSKFCNQCAAPLTTASKSSTSTKETKHPEIHIKPGQIESLSAGDGERKTVTALFADIKGSMELMEDLDPEEARAVVDPALKLMIEATRRYGGYVVQSTGDGIFALFGAPVAHEDHPQRALYAALRLQEEMRRYAAHLRQAGNLPVEARVGVNTGDVVVRSITTRENHPEYTPIGHSTSLAARMQVLAPTGSIAATDGTRKLCEGYFSTFRSLGLTRVKGVSEPVEVFEVTGLGPLRTRLQVAARRGLTKFVGRESELTQTHRALQMARDGDGQIVAVVGEAGVGKSRLFFEFKAVAEAGCISLEAYSISHSKASAYLPVLELLRGYFEISTDDDDRKRRERILGKLLGLDRTLEDTLPYLYSMLGVAQAGESLAQMDPQIRRRRTQEAIKRVLLRESLNQPLIVIFEDLHWIDSETQGLLNHLVEAIANARILLLVNYRPEYRHDWGNRTHYTQLRLDPLGRDSAEEMLGVLLTSPAPAALPAGANWERSRGETSIAARVRVQDDLAPLKRLIIERTEGNPFFMEEIVQTLFEAGTLKRNGGVELTQPLSEIRVPATVQAVLASRIDRLPPSEKELLQTLAVIGREFTLPLVRRVASAASEAQLEVMLGALQSGEFIYEQPAFAEAEYVFKHVLTQEVAYSSVLIERRKLLHERVADAMELLYAGRLDQYLAELAHHYRRSGNTAKAIEYLQRAGLQAVTRSSYAEAIELFNSALGLLKTVPETPGSMQQELSVQLGLGSALSVVRGIASPETGRVFDRAHEFCRHFGSSSQIAAVLVGINAFYNGRGELRRAHELARDLLAMAEDEGDASRIVSAHFSLALDLCFMGEFAQARNHAEHALSLYDPAPTESYQAANPLSGDLRSNLLMLVALAVCYLGYPDQALARSREALVLARKLYLPFRLVAGLAFSALIQALRGEGDAALNLADDAVRVATEHGFQEFLARALAIRGFALVELNRAEEGIVQIEQGVAALRASGTEAQQPPVLASLGEAYLKLGRLAEGLKAVAEGLELSEKNGERWHDAELLRIKGEFLLGRSAIAVPIDVIDCQPETCLRRALEVARQQEAKWWELRATMSLARLLAKQGRRNEARAILSEVYGWFTEGFDTAALKDAKTLLNELAA